MGRIRVGKPDVKPDAPSHVKGVHSGNEGPYEKGIGHNADGTSTVSEFTASTTWWNIPSPGIPRPT